MTANRTVLTVLLALFAGIGPATLDMYLPSLPAIAAALGASATETQMTMTAYLVCYATGQVLYGPISDSLGRRPMILGGLAAYVVAALAAALAPNIGMLILARGAQGLAAAAPVVVGRAVVGDLFRGVEAGRQMALVGSAMAIFPIVAPAAGSAFQVAFGWQANFFALSVLGLVTLAIAVPILKETAVRRGQPLSPRGMRAAYGAVLRHPAYLPYVAIMTLAQSGLFSYFSGATFVLHDRFGLDAAGYGIAFTASALAILPGSIFSSRLVMRLGVDGTLGVGVAMLGLAALGLIADVLLKLPYVIAFVGPMIVYAAALSLVMSQAIAGALSTQPTRAGAASSLLGFSSMCFSGLCVAGVGNFGGGQPERLSLFVAVLGLGSLAVFAATGRLRRRGDQC